MTTYEDTVVAIDETTLTIKSYRFTDDEYRIPLSTITRFDHFEMGFWSGRYRVVGIGFGRLRSWFARGRSATNRVSAISLDVGRLVRPTFVPDDPDAVVRVLERVQQPHG